MPRPFENLSNSLRTSFREPPEATGMRKAESRWRRRRRGYYYLVMAAGLFGLFLILSGISGRDWTLGFILGFASVILWVRRGLALWNLHGSALRSGQLRLAEPNLIRPTG